MTSGTGSGVSSKEQKSHFLGGSRTTRCGPVREALFPSPASPALAQNTIHSYVLSMNDRYG